MRDDERAGATFDPGMPRHPPRNQLDDTLSLWTVQVPAGLAGGLAALLGTLGYVMVGFGVISNCTDQFGCGSDTCAPCAAAGSWINADFYIWIGHADDHRAWGQLADARRALDAAANVPEEALLSD